MLLMIAIVAHNFLDSPWNFVAVEFAECLTNSFTLCCVGNVSRWRRSCTGIESKKEKLPLFSFCSCVYTSFLTFLPPFLSFSSLSLSLPPSPSLPLPLPLPPSDQVCGNKCEAEGPRWQSVPRFGSGDTTSPETAAHKEREKEEEMYYPMISCHSI